MHTHAWPILSITVPGQHRELDERVVAGLVDSIREFGLLSPVVVTGDSESASLVAGAHRLEACKRLGHKMIPAINIAGMVDDELPEEAPILCALVELDENAWRLELKNRPAALKRQLKLRRKLQELRERKQGQLPDQLADRFPEPGSKNQSAGQSIQQREALPSELGRPKDKAKEQTANAAGLTRDGLNKSLRSATGCGRSPLADEEKVEIVDRKKAGEKHADIAKALSCSESTVGSVVRKARDDGLLPEPEKKRKGGTAPAEPEPASSSAEPYVDSPLLQMCKEKWLAFKLRKSFLTAHNQLNVEELRQFKEWAEGEAQ